MLPMRVRWFYLSLACISLCLSYLVYFVVRPGPSIIAIPASINSWISVQPLLVEFSGQLPSFLHTYSFILLTFFVTGSTSLFNLYLSIALWVIVETLFEVGQHDQLIHLIINSLPGWTEQLPSLNICINYFLYGTFDVQDLIAVFMASIAAWLTIQATRPAEDQNVYS